MATRMQIEYRTGDLFTAPESHLIHGCNCRGAYGSGVAGQMRARFPAFAMPLIGAGLAGGEWSRIAAIIEQEATAFTPVVYLYDGIIPK